MFNFSVIIPCYRDEDKLAYLLYLLHQLPNGPDEIIVVDGADSERCHEICNQYSAHWLASEPCRGEQLRAGAALAKSDVLWFLHADARFSKNSLVAMTSALEQGEGIEIRGFGSFTVREYKSYSGRNPRTGKPVPVPEKRLPFFKVGKELKELVNDGVVEDGVAESGE